MKNLAWLCDTCDRSFPAGTSAFSCQGCDFDRCGKCRGDAQTPSPARKRRTRTEKCPMCDRMFARGSNELELHVAGHFANEPEPASLPSAAAGKATRKEKGKRKRKTTASETETEIEMETEVATTNATAATAIANSSTSTPPAAAAEWHPNCAHCTTLLVRKMKNFAWVCDLCESDFSADTAAFSCSRRVCNFDLCTACRGDAKDPSPARKRKGREAMQQDACPFCAKMFRVANGELAKHVQNMHAAPVPKKAAAAKPKPKRRRVAAAVSASASEEVIEEEEEEDEDEEESSEVDDDPDLSQIMRETLATRSPTPSSSSSSSAKKSSASTSASASRAAKPPPLPSRRLAKKRPSPSNPRSAERERQRARQGKGRGGAGKSARGGPPRAQGKGGEVAAAAPHPKNQVAAPPVVTQEERAGRSYFALHSKRGSSSAASRAAAAKAAASATYQLPTLREATRLTMALPAAERRFHAEREELVANALNSQFGRWSSWMLSGFTLLFHGVGSKRRLLQRLATRLQESMQVEGCIRRSGRHVVPCDVLDIEGFDPALTVERLVERLEAAAGIASASPPQHGGGAAKKKKRGRRRTAAAAARLRQRCIALARRFGAAIATDGSNAGALSLVQQMCGELEKMVALDRADAARAAPPSAEWWKRKPTSTSSPSASAANNAHLVVVLHNLDGPGLAQHSGALELLAIVAQAPRLHLICSVDHCNAALQWDTATARALRLLWCEAHTYDPCDREDTVLGAFAASTTGLRSAGAAASAAAASVASGAGASARRGVEFLLKSLTKAHHHLLRHIAGAGPAGVTFRALCEFAKEKWLADKGRASSVRAITGEFTDHKLIAERKSSSSSSSSRKRAPATFVAIDAAALITALDALRG